MNLTTIIAVSNVKNQLWMLELLFESFREYNYKYPIHLLIYKTTEKEEWLHEWKDLNELYPEVQFFYYSDNGSLIGLLRSYHNLHRFYSLREHFKQNPNLEAILYFDSDIILTKELNVDDILENDINYGADINSYNNWEYFVSKRNRVRSERIQEWDIAKPLNQIWSEFNLEEETIKSFNENTAGVPFLLKGLNWQFWDRCLENTVPLKKKFDALNQWFIEGNTQQERADNGYQSFCSDMWIILWLLWSDNKKTKIDHRLNFAWATSNIENVEVTSHIHMAGIPNQEYKFEGKGVAFFKGKYSKGNISPFDNSEEEYLNSIHTNEITKKYANWYYTDYILKVKNKNHARTKSVEGIYS